MQEIYEKLGLFYLGKEIDAQSMQTTDALTLIKNKNFTTHAAIIGMTGSGKTGLGVALIEEAAIDNIPALIIDPKGDMGNLCLTDPDFLPASFEPWVRDEAKTKEIDPEVYAQKQSTVWKEGIESWDQSVERVQRFHQVQKTLYTPGSSAGAAINILSSLDVPPAEVMQESDTFASYLKSTATSLLSLVGIEADPLESKEYILLAQIITHAWLASENLSIESIIGKIINPPFKKIGVLVLDDFYDKEARFGLATKFNALLASPSFSLWLKGENLDIQKLLYDEQGKAKIAIFSISHLNDTERMFFVTLLLNKYIAWMRRQSGTAALKTLLYMDEIFGFFPPTKNPPSKEPMLLLLKQARAFGVGVVLSTQNPVDLDYKGLSNIGTWFIGRLQTNQDIERVIDGLGGKVGSSFDKNQLKSLLANLKERMFFIKSAHLDDVKLFSVRWVMSYLKGPLSKEEIGILMQEYKQKQGTVQESVTSVVQNQATLESYQSIDASILQYFEPDVTGVNFYFPTLAAKASVHFYQQSKGIDEKKSFSLFVPLESSSARIVWEEATREDLAFERYPHTAPNAAKFYALPEVILADKGLKKASSDLKEMLYREENLTLYRCEVLKMESRLHESHSDFMVRVQDVLSEKKELEIEKLQNTYAQKEKTLLSRLSRTQEQIEKESADSTGSMIEAGIAVLGALFGRSSSAKIGRAVSKGSQILKERSDMGRAQERNDAVREEITQLGYELEDKIDAINEKYSIDKYVMETFALKPKKTDISIELCAIVWRVKQQ
ncbi:MAG TPA: DUF87 domain-containing protein [Sulfurovum sp.]|jgi:hypothetical protein|nr:MAG: hypothetical protein B7Y63_02565 [Sulfurovum sp. 35-42-20]OYZ25085.1 MAG: hypothetical protein B7Y23_06945 [Sulfurovum sp. 16-42-52]OYZ48928.1 MAG: hypothetical protein B7Y13_06155 [Sulfurovum sp. 24-42-9]OZA45065.1 MAG: hypothetical protein B7X80_06085 [Sulfurovum sp. 17-42-90]OZA59812.1 MAG: hypothetical protein B7X69_06420 [Sulfurovum sp. 39-42-12]HQR73675.1 DUF87 domain-containing protein [Sulfurovum sp.]